MKKLTHRALLSLIPLAAALLIGQVSNAQIRSTGSSPDAFREMVLHSPKPVIVFFRAQWSDPSKRMASMVSHLASTHPEIDVVGVDIDTNPAIATQYGIKSVPSFLGFYQGKVTGRVIVAMPAERILTNMNFPPASSSPSATPTVTTSAPAILPDFAPSGPSACDSAGSPAPVAVPLQNGNLINLARLKSTVMTASSVLAGYPGRHQTAFLNDGWYNNCRSWIPATMPAQIDVDLGSDYVINNITLGSEHAAFYRDRAVFSFTVRVRSSASSDWKTVLTYNDPANPVSQTRSFPLPSPTTGRYVQLQIANGTTGLPRIDELEIWGSK